MQLALTLLISAFQLLTLIQANPSLPPSFRDNAIVIANQAIITAKEAITASQQTSTSTDPIVQIAQNVQPVSPTFGSVPPPSPVPAPIPNPTPAPTPIPSAIVYDYTIQPKVDAISTNTDNSFDPYVIISTNGGEPFYPQNLGVSLNSNDNSYLVTYLNINDGFADRAIGVGTPTFVGGNVKVSNTAKLQFHVDQKGIHTITLSQSKAVGVSSGEYKYVSGLPLTFTFEVK